MSQSIKLQTPKWMKGYQSDFSHFFEQVFIAVFTVACLDLGRKAVLPMQSSRSRFLLHKAFKETIEAGHFPLWLRQRLFFEDTFFDGPYCEELDQTLQKTAFGLAGRVNDLFRASVFIVDWNRVDFSSTFEKYGINQKSARRWGKALLAFWDEEIKADHEWRTNQTASKSA